MRISAKSHWILSYFVNDICQLVLSDCFSKFLSQIVSKGVIHQVHEVFNSVSEDLVNHFSVVLLYFLLQKPAASLILRQNRRKF